ncbi:MULTISPECIES: AAA family ATPase [unclassified Aeromonas]|uniref:AAA family ATPase n=1 Tax=unclassified Aeromonas TaxID=257493 RepID=UPI003527472A
MKLQQRMERLVNAVCEGMFEREEVISVALLGALCGQNTFLYGPPGTAKSLISRRIACAFANPAYFEYLMNRFSTPEEVFGPISIKALKEDRYVRKTEHYLPQADFAFLDEIWKSSPAILNTLLTLINEHTFRNGEQIEQAPLKALVAASNETPDANQGLDALYDRFIIRLMVGPIEQSDNFERLLACKPTEAAIRIDDSLVVKADEWAKWREQLHEVSLSPETLTIIRLIRSELATKYDKLKVYVSDRRWQRATQLLKAAALFNGRSETNHSDALLLRHCLWTHEENRLAVNDIVEQAVKDTGFDSGINLAQIDAEKESLEKEIHNELFSATDIYDTQIINGHAFFKVKNDFDNTRIGSYIFIPLDNLKNTHEFHPTSETGNELNYIVCQFDGQGTCRISMKSRYGSFNFKPEVLFHKGDKKPNINKRLITSLAESVAKTREQLIATLNKIEKQCQGYEKKLASIFVPAQQSALAIDGITEQIARLKLRIKDCERLEALCK